MVRLHPSVCFYVSPPYNKDSWTVFKRWLKHLLQLTLDKTAGQVFIPQHSGSKQSITEEDPSVSHYNIPPRIQIQVRLL